MNQRPLNNEHFTWEKKAVMKFCLSILILHSTSFSKSVLNNSIGFSSNLLIFYIGFIISSKYSSTQYPIGVTFLVIGFFYRIWYMKLHWIFFCCNYFYISLRVINLVYNFWMTGLEDKASGWLFIFGNQFLFLQQKWVPIAEGCAERTQYQE